MIPYLYRLFIRPVDYYLPLFAIVSFLSLPAAAQQTQLVIQPNTKCIVFDNKLVLNNTSLKADGQLDASKATVVFTGDSASVIGGTTAPVIKTFTLQKAARKSVVLQNNLVVRGAIDFDSGLISLNNQVITLIDSAYLLDEAEQARITGVTGGRVTASLSSVNQPSQLDISRLGATITSSQNMGNITISRFHKPIASTDTSHAGIERTYLIQPANNTALQATLRFHYFDAELNGHDENTLTLWTSSDGVSWYNAGVSARNTSSNYVEQTGFQKLGYVTLTDACNVLPVTLLYFKAICAGKYAKLEWKTATETNTKEFVVQRSTNANNWVAVQHITASNAALGSSYSCDDNNPQPTAYYRLQVTDRNGAITYSPTFSGGCSDIAMPFQVYPNPASSQAVASIAVREASKAILLVYDLNGKQVYHSDWKVQPGINQFVLPVGQFTAGTYLVKVSVNGTISQAKLIKL